ncbi:hypothetical protein HanRHA438_Chr04g0156731 [Helianthus annuus]|nr:hypothetical protein HanRHA438_Chr04g0156731 [Helianthus annuus]
MIDNLSTNLYNRFGEIKPTKLDDVYGSNLLNNKFGRTLTPLRSSFGFDSSAAVAQAVMNSRSGLFAPKTT